MCKHKHAHRRTCQRCKDMFISFTDKQIHIQAKRVETCVYEEMYTIIN